ALFGSAQFHSRTPELYLSLKEIGLVGLTDIDQLLSRSLGILDDTQQISARRDLLLGRQNVPEFHPNGVKNAVLLRLCLNFGHDNFLLIFGPTQTQFASRYNLLLDKRPLKFSGSPLNANLLSLIADRRVRAEASLYGFTLRRLDDGRCLRECWVALQGHLFQI